MAFGTSSKIFSAFITDCLNNTSALDLNADTIHAAIYTDGGTPSQTAASASTAYDTGAWVQANEADNGGWSAGGLALASVASGFSSNVYTLDAADPANGSAATIADTRGCLVYDNTIATPVADQGVCYNAFGGQVAVVAGTLTIVWHASGIFALTL